MASESARKSERRLKFSSVRRFERENVSGQTPNAAESTTAVNTTTDIVRSTRRGPLATIGEILTTGYVAVARRILIGFEAVQDARAARRAATLRGSARAKAISSQ
jgi:hypothetical protein